MKERLNAISSKISASILVIALLVIIGRAAQHTIACFLLAYVIAYLLDPLVVYGEKKGLKRLHSILALYVVLMIISAAAAMFLIPALSISITTLLKQMPEYLNKGKEILNGFKSYISVGFASEQATWFIDNINMLLEKLPEKAGYIGFAALSSTLFNIFNLVLSPILVFFMLLYKTHIIFGISRWLPEEKREAILEAGRETNSCISGYIRGQIVVSIIVSILSVISLIFLGIDYPLLNGIFAGISSVLPFIGVILATIPPLFFGYVKFQSGLILIKVITAFAVIYFLEGYLVKPLVFKESMDLNPLTTIIMVMACGEMFGFWGILLAIPLAAAIKVFANHAKRGSFSRQEAE